jgi:hypothetical protein
MGIFSHLPNGPSGFTYPYPIEQSCRFNADDTAYMAFTPGAPTDNKVWTLSTWVKLCNLDTYRTLLSHEETDNYDRLYFDINNALVFNSLVGAVSKGSYTSKMLFQDPSSWYHIVLAINIGTPAINIYVNGIDIELTEDQALVDHTSWINASGEPMYIGQNGVSNLYLDNYLAEYHFVDGQKLSADNFGTFENGIWVPIRYTGTYGNNGFHLDFSNSSHFGEDQIMAGFTGDDFTGSNGDPLDPTVWKEESDSAAFEIQSNKCYGNLAADLRKNTTSIYPLEGDFSIQIDFDNWTTDPNNHLCSMRFFVLNSYSGSTDGGYIGLFSDSDEFVSDFKLSGSWQGTAETARSNGFGKLRIVRVGSNIAFSFQDGAGGWTALSNMNISTTNMTIILQAHTTVTFTMTGNFDNFVINSGRMGNDFTDYNLATNDQVLDTPTNNWCTMNPLDSVGSPTLLEGNLQVNGTSTTVIRSTRGLEPGTGKWYWELKNLGTIDGANPLSNGIASVEGLPSQATPHRAAYIYSDNGANHFLFIYDSYAAAPGNPKDMDNYTAVGVGDITQVAFDSDTGEVWFGLDDVWFKADGTTGADPGAGTDATYTFADIFVTMTPTFSHAGVAHEQLYNFGQLGFTYTRPTGFKAINSENMPNPEILEGNKGFDVVLYTGDGGGRSLPDVLEFQPDMIWVKNRTDTYDNMLWDSVRDADNDEENLVTNEEDIGIPAFVLASGGIAGASSKGLLLSEGIIDTHNVNTSGDDYVAWCWKRSPGYGLDIVSFTGNGVGDRQIPHNLGVVPEMIITKVRDDVQSWAVYHKDLTTSATYCVFLNLNAAEQDTGSRYGADPSASDFTVGTAGDTNQNDKEFITYLFASIEGYSKVFSYTGNGDVDGPFVHCGFRPRYILIKNTAIASDWWVEDTERYTQNVQGELLFPNLVNAETAVSWIDILSNGFKIRFASGNPNGSGNTIVGIAFAEHPFKYANAR